MTDSEITAYLKENNEALPELRKITAQIRGLYRREVVALNRDIAFLREIGRLPSGFSEISLDDE